ncbi:MAG: L-threonylcarbamoyladenylate synthase [Candidatus Gottesmanbacteria bacterium]|nr:L-threonylcarbamoyladenylate synthase [Candidatus Gottesmanbacteria bacterium]
MESIKQAIQVLKEGGIIMYPTDTAFGIGCRMDDVKAVDRLFKLRKRPRTQATPVLVASKAMALAYYLDPSEIVRHLMKTYWPGALTIIAGCKENLVYSPIRGSGKNIGLRMPNHETALELIRGVGVPILGPSANFHGSPTPYCYEDLDLELIKLVDYVVPGVCSIGNASTVVDCSTGTIRIIRQGVVLLKQPLTLTIDTSRSDVIAVSFIDAHGHQTLKARDMRVGKAQEALPLIVKLLDTSHHVLGDITSIRVNTGPGSYTGLRVGVALANTLGVLLGVPINNLFVGQTVVPIYEDDRYSS